MGGLSHPNRQRVQDRRKVRSRCSRFRKKVLLDNPKAAEEAAEEMARRYRQTFAAYECDRCGAWHVGRP